MPAVAFTGSGKYIASADFNAALRLTASGACGEGSPFLTAKDVTRRPHRALIRLDEARIHLSEGMLEGIITNWDSEIGVRFPVELIPIHVREKIKSQDIAHISAFVNIGAKDPKDIFITDIHAMPSYEEINLDDLC